MSIGDNIRSLRREAGLTQEQIFTQSGISTSYQSQIETGAVKNIGKKIMAKYCEALGVAEIEIRFSDVLRHDKTVSERSHAVQKIEGLMNSLPEWKQEILLGKVMRLIEEDLLG